MLPSYWPISILTPIQFRLSLKKGNIQRILMYASGTYLYSYCKSLFFFISSCHLDSSPVWHDTCTLSLSHTIQNTASFSWYFMNISCNKNYVFLSSFSRILISGAPSVVLPQMVNRSYFYSCGFHGLHVSPCSCRFGSPYLHTASRYNRVVITLPTLHTNCTSYNLYLLYLLYLTN